jgi:hypothetical protein
MELRLKTYDDEQAHALQQNCLLQEQNHMLQKQLDLANTKYDDVHAKLDKSEELSTNRSVQRSVNEHNDKIG